MGRLFRDEAQRGRFYPLRGIGPRRRVGHKIYHVSGTIDFDFVVRWAIQPLEEESARIHQVREWGLGCASPVFLGFRECSRFTLNNLKGIWGVSQRGILGWEYLAARI